MKRTFIVLLLLRVPPAMVAFQQSGDSKSSDVIPDSQVLLHNEEQPGHTKVHHNEADAVSPEPAEEHQDAADNASHQPVEEDQHDASISPQLVKEHRHDTDISHHPTEEHRHDVDISHNPAYSIPHHPVAEHHNDADVSLRPVADHHHDAGISQHPVEEHHNAAYSISLHPVEELQDGTMRLSHQMDVEGWSKQDKTDHQTYMMPPHPKKDDLIVKMSHSMSNQHGSLAIRTQPYVETPRPRKADDDMARVLNVQGHSYNRSKTRRRTRRSALTQRCSCPLCVFLMGQTPQSFQNGKYVNVAYGKTTTVSSIATKESGSYSCTVVDGKGPYRELSSCLYTGETNTAPYWTLDMAGVYTVKGFNFTWQYYKYSKDGTKLHYSTRYRFAGIDLTVDAEICWSTLDYRQHTKFIDRNRDIDYDYIECKPPITGRYIRLRKRRNPSAPLDAYRLHFCEIQIWVCEHGYYLRGWTCVPCGDNCVYRCDNHYGCNSLHEWNLSIHKKTFASPSTSGSSRTRAVDGIRNIASVRECYSSSTAVNIQKRRYWMVDLAAVYKVLYVNITSRVDCCAKSLRYFTIMVHMEDIYRSNPRVDEKNKCAFFNGVFRNGERKKIDCLREMRGRYVTIVKEPPGPLEFCEVEVMGYSFKELRIGDVCGKRKTTDCPVGSECTDQPGKSKICGLGIGHSCTGTIYNVCITRAICEGGTCRVGTGSNCKGNTNICIARAICDGGICRVKLNGDCALHRDKCSSGSVCDRESGNKCKLTTGTECTKTDDCVKGAMCDNLDTCKYTVNNACNNSSQCVAGAICDSTKRCKCDPPAKVNGAFCAPPDGRAGSPCKNPTSPCKVAHSKCSSATGIGECVCDDGYQSVTDFTCKLVPGQKCKEHADCVSRACESAVCRAENGEKCNNSDSCSVDSTCDTDGVCKIKLGKTCSTQPTQCLSGAVCLAGKCKLKLGQECTDDTYCAPSAVCSRNLYSKNVTVCNLRAGQRCLVDNSTLCTLGTLCTSDGVCRLEARQGCNVKARDPLCLSDAKCDPGKRQCRKVIGAECERDDECETNAVCDKRDRCKLGTGQACTNSPDLCLFGAACRNGKCSCFAGSTKTNSVKCDPLDRKVTGTCQPPANASVAKLDSGCDDDRASCVHGVCQCHDNYVTLRNYTCGAGPGVLCKNSGVRCVAGTVCDIIGVCRLDVGEKCEGPLGPMCKIGTTCSEDHVCKAQLNGNCGSNRDMCSKGTVCDATDTCKIARGDFCREDQVCVAGATCQGANDSSTEQCTCVSGVSKRNGDICDPADGRVGGRCSPSSGCNVSNAKCNPSTSKCECEDGFVTEEEDFSCKLAVGKSCTTKDASCKTGMTCDSVANECRVNLGEKCDMESTDPCETNAICDDYGICKLDLNGNCSGSNVAHCKAGTFCDVQDRCRYGSGQECNNTSREEQCVAGADCVDSTCVCNTEITTIVGVMCVPVTGRASAVCNDIDEPCEVSHSACVDGICVCVDGFLPTHDFTCSLPSAVSTARESGGMLGLILALSAVAIALIGFGFIMYWRGRQQKKAQADIKAKGAASMHELKEMAAEVTSMTAEPSRVTELTSDVTSDATSHYTSDVTSEFVSEVNSEVPASDVTSALAATEAPA